MTCLFKKWFFAMVCSLCILPAVAQVLQWTPSFIQEASTPITITLNAASGNGDLANYTPTNDVFVHIGAITNLSTGAADWRNVPFTWGTTNPAANCTFLGNNQWRFTITGGLRSFFNITNANERIQRIAILFRNGAGTRVQRNADGADMYIPVYDNGNAVRLNTPIRTANFTPVLEPLNLTVGANVNITASSSIQGTFNILFNGTNVASTSTATNLSAVANITAAGQQTIVATNTVNNVVVGDTIRFLVAPPANVLPLPAGLKDGINYEPGDTSVTLVLFAPNKTKVAVLGDFNNWIETLQHQMNKTPDGNRYWLRITGLTRGVEYAYQYLLDGNLRVADYLTEKILDPEDDPFIPAATYPNLKPYPTGRTTGNVSIFQTAKPAYNWRINNFVRPDKRNLVMYELLVRDFIATQNYNTLRDTLTYLKRLGINSIHLMPINEFEGNNSWGYNPSFMLAPDKYYGTENALKQFIDECHAQGIAVIIDMVLNHQFGESPMVRMYWDAANNRPATNSPWFNPVAKHAFNVGFDMNHETQATRDFVDKVVEHWLVNYKIDGFRWDLSKGFTQVQTCDDNGGNCNVNTWNNYDSSRVAIWNRIYAKMQTTANNSYCILEHLGGNNEERDLANRGMLLWANMNHNFNEATMGNLGSSNFEGALAVKRNWPVNHLMSYQESHDEERLMYRNRNFGVSTNPNHDVRNLNVGLARNQAAAAFWAMMPGPKLLWQFGELGYDFSINTCENITIINNNCRTSPKPIRWDYYNVPERRALYNAYSKLLNLRTNPRFTQTFTSGTLGDHNFTGAIKSMTITSDSLNLVVVGNFAVTRQQTTVSFPATGTWFSLMDGTTKNVTNAPTTNITLEPGEYFVYTNKNLSSSSGGGTVNPGSPTGAVSINVAPNPAMGSNANIRVDVTNPSGNMAVDLLDITGRKLHTFYNGSSQATFNTQLSNTGFSGLRLQAGVYLIRVVYAGETNIKKFVITP